MDTSNSDTSYMAEKVKELTDIELAILLSLLANQHCMIQTEDDALHSLENELRLVARNTFGLTSVMIRCDESTSLEDLSNGVLVHRIPRGETEGGENESFGPLNSSNPQEEIFLPKVTNADHGQTAKHHERGIAEMIILTGLSSSSDHVQIQILELLRTKRIFTHTAIYTAPKTFLLVFVKSRTAIPLVHHLNSLIFISHFHDIEDGFLNLEDSSEWIEDDQDSMSSVKHRSVVQGAAFRKERPFLLQDDIQTLAKLRDLVTISAEVRAYLQNIVTFLRLHRAVSGGISPVATKHFDLLTRCLAPLHGLNFVTPSLVSLAARKIYPHRTIITNATNERSLQYGSDLSAVSALLEGVNPELVLDEVLKRVDVPL